MEQLLLHLHLLWQTLLEICLRFAVATPATTTVALAAASAQSIPLSFCLLSSLSLLLLLSLFAACLICCEIALLFQRVHLRFARASCLVPSACCRLEISAFSYVCVCVYVFFVTPS